MSTIKKRAVLISVCVLAALFLLLSAYVIIVTVSPSVVYKSLMIGFCCLCIAKTREALGHHEDAAARDRAKASAVGSGIAALVMVPVWFSDRATVVQIGVSALPVYWLVNFLMLRHSLPDDK